MNPADTFKTVVRLVMQLPADELDTIVQLAFELMPENHTGPTERATKRLVDEVNRRTELATQPPIVQVVHEAFKKASKALPKKGKSKFANDAMGTTKEERSEKARKMNEARWGAKRKAERKAKPKGDYDPAKSLANRAGFKKPSTGGGTPNGVTARVLATLAATTGKLSAKEVEEFTDMGGGKLKSKASMILSGLYNKGSVPGLHREATKLTLDSGKTVPGFVYWLDDKAKANTETK